MCTSTAVHAHYNMAYKIFPKFALNKLAYNLGSNIIYGRTEEYIDLQLVAQADVSTDREENSILTASGSVYIYEGGH